MKAEDLIKNNSLTNIEVTGDQTTVVFTDIALTAVYMSKLEVTRVWEKACAAFVKDAENKKQQKIIRLITDDVQATEFQTIEQYRSWLIETITSDL